VGYSVALAVEFPSKSKPVGPAMKGLRPVARTISDTS
jgi:hypothetical protein